jgi:hypothetical protein
MLGYKRPARPLRCWEKRSTPVNLGIEKFIVMTGFAAILIFAGTYAPSIWKGY